jgi:hypothetical protein
MVGCSGADVSGCAGCAVETIETVDGGHAGVLEETDGIGEGGSAWIVGGWDDVAEGRRVGRAVAMGVVASRFLRAEREWEGFEWCEVIVVRVSAV